jgi:NAD(P)-dependent dehydrogenase (short-subunit alcohol dehydrogenase family)
MAYQVHDEWSEVMGTFAVTGAASGMGRATADRLRAAGHTVIGVDLHDVDVVADLSTSAGRAAAASEVLERSGGRLDGALLAAGLGPVSGRERLIVEVNHFGVVELATAWRDAFAASGDAKVVVVGSNSTTLTPLVPKRFVRALLAGDPEKAMRVLRLFGRRGAPFAYAGSKLAVTRWARHASVTPEWCGAGIRLNVIAPGAVNTPLLGEQLGGSGRAAIEGFPVPVGRFGEADELARWIEFMLSDAADFLCGSVVFVDGGSDAYLRPDGWPQAPGVRDLRGYIRRVKAWRTANTGQ